LDRPRVIAPACKEVLRHLRQAVGKPRRRTAEPLEEDRQKGGGQTGRELALKPRESFYHPAHSQLALTQLARSSVEIAAPLPPPLSRQLSAGRAFAATGQEGSRPGPQSQPPPPCDRPALRRGRPTQTPRRPTD